MGITTIARRALSKLYLLLIITCNKFEPNANSKQIRLYQSDNNIHRHVDPLEGRVKIVLHKALRSHSLVHPRQCLH